MKIDRRSFVQGSTALGAAAARTAAAQPVAGARPPAAVHQQPYIDRDEWRDQPVRHRYVHGGFKTSNLRFSFYFPPKEQYQGRFFHPVMHVAGNENNASGRLARLDGASIRSRIAPAAKVSSQITHTFTKPGTYFPVVRVYAHKDGNQKTPFGLAQNLARVRVVVT